jgi:hypothetical protein
MIDFFQKKKKKKKMLRNEAPEGASRSTPNAASHLWTNSTKAVQNIDTTRHPVVVNIVLANHTQADAIVDGTRSHVYALGQQQVSGSKRDGVLVIDQVLGVLG